MGPEMKRCLLHALSWATAILALGLAACNGGGPTLVVAAAADLRFAMEELGALFRQECRCEVRFVFASSGTLAQQIRGGLPADVFFSADSSYLDALAAEGYTLPGTERTYALGLLALAVPADASPPAALDDLLEPRFRRIAIASPEHAPYGRAAKEALERAGLWKALYPRIIVAENASQAAQMVETGDAQAGLIPLSLAIPRADKLRWTELSPPAYEPLRQKAAVLAHAPSPELGRRFLELVTGPRGQAVLKRYGFLMP